MKSLIIFFVLTFLSFSLISAQSISILPSTIDLGTVYPNQNYTENVTITSDENVVIYFSSSNPNIEIFPEFLNLNPVTENTTLTFHVLPSASIGNFSVDMDSSVIIPETQNSNSPYMYGPSPFFMNKSIQNKTNKILTNNTQQNNQTQNQPTKKTDYTFLKISIGLLLILVLTALIIKRKNRAERRLEDNNE